MGVHIASLQRRRFLGPVIELYFLGGRRPLSRSDASQQSEWSLKSGFGGSNTPIKTNSLERRAREAREPTLRRHHAGGSQGSGSRRFRPRVAARGQPCPVPAPSGRQAPFSFPRGPGGVCGQPGSRGFLTHEAGSFVVTCTAWSSYCGGVPACAESW